jgi:hypothetical protein
MQTMNMGQQRARVLLVVTVLWAALPAIAAASVLARPSCCRHMMRCCETVTSSSHACCMVHTSGHLVAPAPLATSEHLVPSADLLLAVHTPVPPVFAGAALPGTGVSPPTLPSGSRSILRI